MQSTLLLCRRAAAATIRRGAAVPARVVIGECRPSIYAMQHGCLSTAAAAATAESSSFSSSPQTKSMFAAVDHSQAYEMAMQGPHGKQLALAALEGLGKDDPDFDPFLEEEMEEDRLMGRNTRNDKNSKNKPSKYNDDKSESDSEEESDREDNAMDDADDDGDLSSVYNPDGSLRRTASERATLRAGAPSGGMMAVIEIAGTQHKVTTDDLLIVNRLKPVDQYHIGSVHNWNQVLLVGSSHLTLVGMPYVTGATVQVMVEEITMDAKVTVFKKRRRKHSQRKNGFRRDVTLLRVLDIQPPAAYQNHKHDGRVMSSSPPLPTAAAAVPSSSS